MREGQKEVQTILRGLHGEFVRRRPDRATLAPLPMVDGESMVGDLDLPYSSMPKLRTTQWKKA